MYYPNFETFKKLSKEGNLIPVYREILADTETPVSALMKLQDHPHIFLLESVEGGEKWGRYTFLGSAPRKIFRVQGKNIHIEENGTVRTLIHGGDPLKILKSELKAYRPAAVEGLPRFFGGAIGYLGYDMVRYFERLPSQGENDLNADDAVFLVTDTVIIFDNTRHTIKVVSCALTEDGENLEDVYHKAAVKIDGLVNLLREPLTKKTAVTDDGNVPSFRSNMTPDAFKAMIRKAKEYIVAGDIIQVVLSQRFEIENGLDPIDLYRALRYINPSPYLFFFKTAGLCLIGSSPEVMVRQEEGMVELKPIAGTKKRGGTEQEDRRLADELLKDPKERAEHVMLVDLGRNDLGRIARIGSVQVNQLMTVERYSHVMHLVSLVQAQLSQDQDSFDVLRATFPAGTLSGAPKIRAMEIIDELEPARRGPYGGAVGYFSFNGNMDFCITIRTLMLKDNKIYIQAGAGIVADSDPDTEFQETVNKAQGMMQAIGLAKKGFEL
ncbi:MAG: Anthranilate synthase component 1 [Syntrophus sp. SKADARSKE-3]|nr:Anthranilate synthase component 1 [Syntrophus sp. SKADARSKE-3]